MQDYLHLIMIIYYFDSLITQFIDPACRTSKQTNPFILTLFVYTSQVDEKPPVAFRNQLEKNNNKKRL